jgi:hypothetical protein
MLNLGTFSGINLNLISPFSTANGDVYYFVDSNGDGSAINNPGATFDAILRQRLDSLLNSGSDTTITQRSVLIEGLSGSTPSYRLTLPTLSELATIRSQTGGLPPTGWATQPDGHVATYHSADRYAADKHSIFGLSNGETYSRSGLEEDAVSEQFVALKVEVIPTYILSTGSIVEEGGTATFVLRTAGVSDGTPIPYTISGVSASDVVGGQLSGTATVGSNGQAVISVLLSADNVTEGSEFLTVATSGQQKSIEIIDTSLKNLSSNLTSVDEGNSFRVTLQGVYGPGALITALVWGKNVTLNDIFSLSGVPYTGNFGTENYFQNLPQNASLREAEKIFSTYLFVGQNSTTTVDIAITPDQFTEDLETIFVQFTNGPNLISNPISIVVRDTSKTAVYSIVSGGDQITEGSSATFTLSTTNVTAGTSVPYTISGVSASDIVGGQLSGTATVGVNGQATISVLLAADALTEGSETLTVTAQGQSATVKVNDTSLTPQGTYALSAAASTFNEGSSATFTLSTTNVTAGTSVPYTISGVSASDVVGGQLSGAVNIGTNGQATINVPLVADLFTEGNETLTVTAGGQSASVTILDTSTSPMVPTYAINAAASSVIEGGVAIFNLNATNVAAGTGVNYLISGVSEADVVGGALSGSAIIDTNGRATISVPIAADSMTEGTETLRVIVSDKTATMSIADTSVAQTTTNTTNITNNITNNVTNNSNTTTNINSGNTTNNFINSFNRSLKVFDVNVTNDTKVVVTRIGDITRIEGNQENNTVVGTDAIDRLLGGGGSDRFYSSKGNDVIDGGDGTDAVTFKGQSSDFRVEKVGGNWLVRDTRTDTNLNQGEDTLTGVERVGFEDKVLALDTDGVAGKAYRVYKAAFNRDPMQGDASGLGFWIDKMDNAMDLVEVSARFVDSNEFRTLYGTNPTNAQFLTKLYQNVLGRDPEATGYNWWLNELNTNPSKTKAKALADFAESGENQAGVASLIGNGITYEPWVG